MSRARKPYLRSVLSYLLASIACLIAIIWPNFKGHVHVPFSSFPEILVWSPISPFMTVMMFDTHPVKSAVALAMFAAVFVLVFRLLNRKARRQSLDAE